MIESSYIIQEAPHLALLSDLHGRPFQQVISSLKHNNPNIVCIAGDIIHGMWSDNDISPLDLQPNVLPFLEECASIAPTYLSLGNHERKLDQDDINLIEETGVIVLDNCWVQHDKWIIGGLTSAYVTDYRRMKPTNSECRYPSFQYIQDKHKPEVNWLEEYVNVTGYHILLSHHPEYYPLVPSGIQLMISGHTHGGQIRLFNQGLYAPGQGWFPKWTRGKYNDHLVVSAGLSNTASLIPRLFNPTEIVYIFPPDVT